MEQKADKIDRVSIVRNSWTAKERVKEIKNLSHKIENDPEKKQRLEDCQCMSCYYLGNRIGGASITTKPCGMCGEVQMYANTSTDTLCHICAKKSDLCKRCGGDLYMRERRKNWPEGL